jgi:two-component system phosphate regulon sensor histidine kinase PhoR
MKILIVEDNADDRSLLRCNLENHGCETIVEAGDGEEALALANRHKPDLIVSDALMPRMDGFQFLRAVKIDPVLKSIPFIFYSAVYTGFKEEELALSLGAEAFIVKPMEPEELWRSITAILERRGTGRDNPVPGELKKEDEEFIRSYGDIVSTKLEEKIRELEAALLRRQEAEAALRDQFAAINTVFDSISAIVFVAEIDEDRLLFLNRHGCQLFGDDWKGKKCTDLVPEEHRKALGICSSEVPERRNAAQRPLTWEFMGTRSGKWYQCMERIIPWTDGHPVRLAIAFDVTERKEVERLKDEMISSVSHDMRTPLTAMLGFTEFMLENEVPPSVQREYLQIINKETEKLNDLIGNFLSLQRLQARHDRAAGFLSVDIGALLGETDFHYSHFSKSHRLTVKCPPGLPPILGDQRDLREMLDNLVSNAVKFSPDGGEVHLEARQEGDHITISVRDEGIGIPADMLEKIFERFYQVDGTDRRRFRGTGLGLALVREVVHAHGGRVWAESVIEKGSTFHVSLPLQVSNSRPTVP